LNQKQPSLFSLLEHLQRPAGVDLNLSWKESDEQMQKEDLASG
jgi:hypothetical protein